MSRYIVYQTFTSILNAILRAPTFLLICTKHKGQMISSIGPITGDIHFISNCFRLLKYFIKKEGSHLSSCQHDLKKYQNKFHE